MSTKKKLLQAAAGSAGGAAALNVEDVFSTYIYEGNGSAQVIENGINLGQSNDGGSLEFDGSTGYVKVEDASAFDVGSSDDYTVEMFVYFVTDPNNSTVKYLYDGKASTGTGGSAFFLAQESDNDWSTDGMNGTAFSSTDFEAGQWYHIAITRTSDTVRSFKNGTLIHTASSGNASYDTDQFNIGARYTNDFILTNAYISNFRFVNGTSLYSSGFTVPTSELTAVTNTALLTLQGTTPLEDNSTNANTVTSNGTTETAAFGPFDAADAGEGGLVWLKERTNSRSHALYDTDRGATYRQDTSNDFADQVLTDGLTSFNANGFTIGSSVSSNNSGSDIASWTFRKAPKFFDVVTYTGTGSSNEVSHSLESVPAWVIIKSTSDSSDWKVYARTGDVGSGYYYSLFYTTGALNSTADADANNINLSAAITDTVVNVNTLSGGASPNDTNISGRSYVMYLFAHNDGDGTFGPTGDQDIIKCGSVTTDGSGNATVDLGFEPQWLMVKSSSSALSGWHMLDNMRGIATGSTYQNLLANSSGAEATSGSNYFEFTADGFKINAYPSGASTDWVYIAIRRGPMAVPTDATEVFAIDDAHAASGSGPAFVSNFVTDMVLEKQPTTSSDWYAITRLMGNKYVRPNSTGVEATGASTTWDYMNGAGDPFSSSPSFQGWMWRRAPNYFDVVAYTGNGTAGRTVSHNLGVAPEMMWVKRRDAAVSWPVFHTATGSSKRLFINSSNAEDANTTTWNAVDPTASNFTVGNYTGVNASGGTYIAYLFASLDGVSKVGSFTGTGSSQTIDCGFSSGARFVLIKGADVALGWVVFDVERGIVTGNDPFLQLQSTAAENTGNDHIDPHSSGFIVNPSMIVSGSTYIFYAIA